MPDLDVNIENLRFYGSWVNDLKSKLADCENKYNATFKNLMDDGTQYFLSTAIVKLGSCASYLYGVADTFDQCDTLLNSIDFDTVSLPVSWESINFSLRTRAQSTIYNIQDDYHHYGFWYWAAESVKNTISFTAAVITFGVGFAGEEFSAGTSTLLVAWGTYSAYNAFVSEVFLTYRVFISHDADKYESFSIAGDGAGLAAEEIANAQGEDGEQARKNTKDVVGKFEWLFGMFIPSSDISFFDGIAAENDAVNTFGGSESTELNDNERYFAEPEQESKE